MTEAKTTKTRRKRTTKAAPNDCPDGKCPVNLTPVPAHSPADPFKPLGASEEGGLTTISFAAEIAGVVYLKTVTVRAGLQSEAIAPLGGAKIIKSNTPGFYKVVVE